MPSYAQSERAALADRMEQVGPDAPTLCEGWTARDLAAHLVARERRPDTGPGIMVKPLAGWTDRVRLKIAARPWDELLHLVRTGPPRTSLFGLPGVDAAANTVEFYIHHEDVRRAGDDPDAPRELDPEFDELLWKRATRMGLMLRRVPVGVAIARPGGEPVTLRKAKDGAATVTLTGEAQELVLYLFGRKSAAVVGVDGEPEAVQALREARIGF